MKAFRQWFPLLAALGLLIAAFGWIFQLRIGGGDLYPEYSSLRADAIGTRAFYAALAEVPGLQVERDFRPVAKLGALPRLVLLPGLHWQDWQKVPAGQLAALNAAAGGGARVVLAFRADQKREERDQDGERIGSKNDKTKKAAERADAAKKTDGKNVRRLSSGEKPAKELAREWGVTLKQRWLIANQEGAVREADAPAGLPARVAWQSDLHFSVAADSGWRVLYRRAGEAVIVEKPLGRGSIVLIADAYCLSNEAMHRDRATGLLSWLVGDNRRVTFFENPLGLSEDNGVGFLARRYGLGGAMALTALLGGLYAWRRLVAFIPPRDAGTADGAELLTYEPAAGMTTLLRRSLGPSEVLGAGVEEWRKSRRAGGGSRGSLARLEAEWKTHDPAQSPSKIYNALVRALKPR